MKNCKKCLIFQSGRYGCTFCNECENDSYAGSYDKDFFSEENSFENYYDLEY